MNRLQQKCFVAATGLHLLLLVILFIGPAFLSSRDKADNMPVLDFVPMKTIDAALSGGGSPIAKPPPPAPQPQPPQPQPQPQIIPPAPTPQPQPVKPVVRTPEPSPDPVEKKSRLPDVSTTIVMRSQPKPPKPSTPDRDTDVRAEAKQRAAFSSAARNLRAGLSSSTTVEMYGPGGGGPTYAGYNMEVQRIYKQHYDAALLVAGDIADEQTSVEAAVTIASSGTVVSARIRTPSKNPALNKLVQRVLDAVTFLRPFPEGAKDSERTLNIIFDLKPKPGIG